MTVAGASTVVTPLANGTFDTATTTDAWFDPTGQNDACLTAGTDTSQLPIPGCNNSSPDASGSGVLQFTSNAGNEVGSTFYQTALPTSEGLDVTFNTYQYDGTGADGISFDLTAADPSNPSPPPSPGPSGGSLGYSTNTSSGTGTPGIAHGYLGFGLDVYGNYENTTYQGSTCSTPSGLTAGDGYPESVTVHGPGNNTSGYCILTSTAQTIGNIGNSGSGGTISNLPNSAVLDQPNTTTRPSPVEVEVAINPSSQAATAQSSGLSVPADGWLIAYLPYVGTTPVSSWSSTYSLTGLLPTTSNNSELANATDFPSSWIDPTTGIPYLLNFGWTASTGGSTEIHQVATLNGNSLNGPVPVLGATSVNVQSDQVLPNSTTSFTLTPAVLSDTNNNTAAESDAVTMTDTFPSGITPGTPSPTSPDWNCPASSGQVVTCTYTPSSTIQPGNSLPAVVVPATVSSSAGGSLRSVVRVSSLDGDPGTVTDVAQVYPWSMAASAPSSGGPVTFTETGLPIQADGNTVQVLNGTTTLCSFILGTTTDSCSASTLSAGTQSNVTAELEAGNGYQANDVTVPSFSVTKSPTTTSVAVSPTTPLAGEPATWTATVASSASGTPTGTVAFSEGGTTLAGCSAVQVVSGAATCTASLPAGAATVTAAYSGDTSFSSSTGSLAVSVAKSPTTTSVAVSPTTPLAGEPATWTATVASSASGTPTGTVAFSEGGTTLAGCSAVQVASGAATCTASLPAGAATVTATYSGDASFSGSTGSLAVNVALQPHPVTVTTPPSSPVTPPKPSPSPPPSTTPSTPVRPAPPGDVVVRFVAASPSSGTAVVSWRPATVPSGTSVRYQVTAEPSGKTCVTSTAICRIRGLRPGVAYHFTVVTDTSNGTATSASRSTSGHEILPHLVPNRAALVLKPRSVPVQVTCQRAECVGTAYVTVARRVMRHGKQVGWRHLVLGKGSFRVSAGHRSTLHLVETPLGHRLLPVQLRWWLARQARFHLTLTVKEIGQRTTNTPTYLTGKA